jgi:hypothetical protein
LRQKSEFSPSHLASLTGGALRLIVSGESQHDAGLGRSRYLAPQVLDDTACFRNQSCIGLCEHAAFEVDGIFQSDSNMAPGEIRECHSGKGGSSNADCGECRIPRMLVMASAFGLWRSGLISNAPFAVGVAAILLVLLGGWQAASGHLTASIHASSHHLSGLSGCWSSAESFWPEVP